MARRSKAACTVICCFVLVACSSQPKQKTNSETTLNEPPMQPSIPASTQIFMHNVELHRAPGLVLRIDWIRGNLHPVSRKRYISLDDDRSFYIEITDGLASCDLNELGTFAQDAGLTSGAITNIKFVPSGQEIAFEGLYRHVLPVRVTASVSPEPQDQVRLHVIKISLLGVPVKGLLNKFHLKTSDLMNPRQTKGIRFDGDDVIISASDVLPPPRIAGDLRGIRVVGNRLVETFGNATSEVLQHEEWRNYLHLKGGAIGFGKLFMNDADIMMIDTSADEWFDLDLDHYQAQMVYGYTRMTPQAGLLVFMPDLRLISKQVPPGFNLNWLKNRYQAPPADVPR